MQRIMTKKLLLIDDEPEFLELMHRIISEKTDLAITRTPLPHEVPEIIANEEFDLVISDIQMPGFDCLSVLELFGEHRKEKIIMVSSINNGELEEKALKNGAAKYLEKPFKKKDLILAINEVLNTNY
jgi:two-component system, response regulator YesN